MATRSVNVELIAKVDGYRAGLRTAVNSTKEFKGELDQMRQNSKQSFDQLTNGAAIAGAAMLGLVGWATSVGMAFDKQMSEVAAITNATAGELDSLRQAALEAGKATTFSATEAAKAQAELAKAGLSTADILGGALNGALALAAAGSLDLAEAAEIAAKTMGQFQLTGKDVGHVADLLAGAANASATDVHDLGEALKMGGGAAHAAGMTLEDTTTVLTAFAKQALTGSDAGTSLKTMLSMLSAPTGAASEKMAELGIDVYDASGTMVDAYGIAGQLQKALGGLTQEKRNEAVVTIFGADAQRAANALYAVGADGLHGLNKEMLAQADAARVAQQKTDNLAGDVERLTGSLESLAIEAQSGATGPLRWLAQTLDTLVGNFSDLPSGVQQSILILAGLAGGALLAAVAFVKARTAVLGVMSAMEAAGPRSARLADGLGNVTRAAGKATLVLGALAAATALAQSFSDTSVDAQGLSDSLLRLGDSGEKAGELTRQFGDDLGGLRDAFGAENNPFAGPLKSVEQLVPGLSDLNDQYLFGSPSKYAEQIGAIDDALGQLVRDGHVEEARAAFVRIMQAANLSASEAEAALPKYVNATREAEKAADEQGRAADNATAANRKLAGAFGEAASAADGLIKKFAELNGKELDWREAERDAEAAVDDLTAALKDSNGSLDIHDEKGRNAAAAVDALAEAAAKAAQKKMDETHSVEAANAVYQGYIGQLRNTLAQAGYTQKQIDDLVASIAAMPSNKVVTISANVKVSGTSQLQHVFNELDRRGMAKGGILTFAGGGTYENHTAQIAPAGAMRVWAEPETGGEAYIPLSESKRERSTAILADVNRRFGHPLSGGGGNVNVTVSAAPGADSQLLSGVMKYLRFTVDNDFAGDPKAALSRRR